MVDPGGCVYGHLYLLRPAESGGKVTGNSAPPPAIKAGSTWWQVLHQLNNVFASIHSSLDLVLSGRPRAEAEAFLLQAQERARTGALIVNELQLRGKELLGLAEAKGSDAKAASPGSAEPVADPPPAALEGSERLLLAEDDKPMRTLIRAVLTYRGYEIIEAVDGEDALNKYLSQGPFDLVILDRDMPVFSGAEVLKRIRAHDPSARVLSLSGSGFHDEAEQDPVTPFNGLLSKPFRNIDLLKLVRQILDQTPAA
jgi:CheY-like chemotaxis protein